MDLLQVTVDQISQALARFGLREFRPAQREIIEAVLRREQVLCVMPTGSGKSLCYQLPAILGDGISLVVSPLIALMKDQVDSLRQLNIPADFLNSSLTAQEQGACLDRVQRGECRLLYVAPERFRSRRFIEIIKQQRLQLFAVDEAHCISEWGHDFRHDYARLGEFRAQLGNPPTIALTATATPDVQQDIVRQLKLTDPRVFVAGFKRDNLHYEVKTCASKHEKHETLVQFLRHHQGAGIIYVSTRAACSEVASQLKGAIGQPVGIYHGKVDSVDRRRVQDEFMEGRTPVIVATNAFGMGIDKPDVRFVVHYNLPGTIEAYYQESGRAGRDGLPSSCLLLFSWQDRFIQEFFIESAYPEPAVVEQVYEFLRQQEDDPIQITQSELKDHLRLDISNEGVGTCERLLEKAGAIERLDPLRNMAIVRIHSNLPTLVDLLPKNATRQRKLLQAIERIVAEDRFESCYVVPSQLARMADLPLNRLTGLMRELEDLEAIEYVPPFRGRAIRVKKRDRPFADLQLDFDTLQQRKQHDYEKLDAIVQYAQSYVCRQQFVLSYFGDRSGDTCGHCDNCEQIPARPGSRQPALESQEVDDAVRRAIRIALSGVARTKGRFGKSMVAAMLAGSQNSKIARWKLDTLSTFGLLRYLTQPEIVQLLDSLLRARLIEQNEIDRFRPVVQLTAAGTRVMKQDDAAISLALDASLMAKIRAAELAGKPTPPGANSVPTKVARTSHAGSDAGGDQSPLPATDADGSDDLWTWRLLAMGFRIDECAAIRRCSTQLVCQHIVRAAEQGKPLSLGWVFSADQQREIEAALADQSGQPIPSIVERLSFSLSESQLLVLRHYQKSLKHKDPVRKNV